MKCAVTIKSQRCKCKASSELLRALLSVALHSGSTLGIRLMQVKLAYEQRIQAGARAAVMYEGSALACVWVAANQNVEPDCMHLTRLVLRPLPSAPQEWPCRHQHTAHEREAASNYLQIATETACSQAPSIQQALTQQPLESQADAPTDTPQTPHPLGLLPNAHHKSVI